MRKPCYPIWLSLRVDTKIVQQLTVSSTPIDYADNVYTAIKRIVIDRGHEQARYSYLAAVYIKRGDYDTAFLTCVSPACTDCKSPRSRHQDRYNRDHTVRSRQIMAIEQFKGNPCPYKQVLLEPRVVNSAYASAWTAVQNLFSNWSSISAYYTVL